MICSSASLVWLRSFVEGAIQSGSKDLRTRGVLGMSQARAGEEMSYVSPSVEYCSSFLLLL